MTRVSDQSFAVERARRAIGIIRLGVNDVGTAFDLASLQPYGYVIFIASGTRARYRWIGFNIGVNVKVQQFGIQDHVERGWGWALSTHEAEGAPISIKLVPPGAVHVQTAAITTVSWSVCKWYAWLVCQVATLDTFVLPTKPLALTQRPRFRVELADVTIRPLL